MAHAALAAWVAGATGTRSDAEQRLLDQLRASGAPEPVVNDAVALGQDTFEFDLAWVCERLVVEVDGPGHTRPTRRRADGRRDAACAEWGLRIIRVTPPMIDDGSACRRIRAALAAGSTRPDGPLATGRRLGTS